MFQCTVEYPDSTEKEQIMEVTSQPAAFEPRDFHTGLMSCCDDMGVCCCGFFCLACLGCSIASDMNECCCCGLGMPIRSVYRTKYNIPGSMCNDWMVAYCCLGCAACQMKRDINIRKSNGTLKP
ncbi:placenta-specific gene 8 protein-like [Carassius carassius]|uniref:placenta-specific gene 8 protein-like n=1 Tax=Carassius carassius TaxID=217509 RepID=UPI00286974C1|nr:placenta-specific gene 8 protein-like [Carassius carassius]